MRPLHCFYLVIGIMALQVTQAQTLSGTLFFHYAKGTPPPNSVLQAIEFPSSKAVTLRDGLVDDMLLDGDTLWVAAADSLIAFDAITYQQLLAVPADHIQHLSISANGLLTGHSQKPFLRMYSRTDGSFIANIADPIIDVAPADVEASGITGFALYSDTVLAISLDLIQTITPIPTPHPYGGGPSGPGYNMFLTKEDSVIYIFVDYATGAPRFSELALDPVQFTVTTLFHKDFLFNQIAPFYGDDRLFFSSYLTYYDFADDSVYNYPTFEPLYDIAYDTVSRNLFYVDLMSSLLIAGPVPSGFTASHSLGSYTFSLAQKGVFYHTTPTGISSPEENQLEVFPNPVHGTLHLDFPSSDPKTIQVLNMQGQILKEESATANTTIDVARLPAGMYMIRWQDERSQGVVRFVKE